MYQAIEDFTIRAPGWGSTWRWAQTAESEVALGRLPVMPLTVAVSAVLPEDIYYRIDHESLGFCHVRHTLRTSHVLSEDQRQAIARAIEQAGGAPS